MFKIIICVESLIFSAFNYLKVHTGLNFVFLTHLKGIIAVMSDSI